MSTPPRILSSPASNAPSNAVGDAGREIPHLGPATAPRHKTPAPSPVFPTPNGNATATSGAATPSRVPAKTPPSIQSDPFEEDPAEVLFRFPDPKPTAASQAVREVRAQPAPIWRRFLAWLFDASVIVLLVGVYLRIAAAVLGVKPVVTDLKGLDFYVASIRAWQSILFPGAILGLILALAYAATFAILRAGATPGRSLMRIHLVDRNGSSPAPARTVFRALLSTVSFATFLGGIWPALFDRHGRTLHDWLTSTFLVRSR